MEAQSFDEKAQEALGLLFENFWVLRSEEPHLYQKIRERENQIKRYVSEKFGFDLIVHQHFIKLEKIPVETKSWMGIQAFSSPMDYAIFCCGLAFTENRSVDEQFLLSDICEDIADFYPGEFGLDWTNYNHRKSLVRALKQLVGIGVIKTVDGDIELFTSNEENEVLYEVTVYARYFMRSYPDDLFQYESTEEILQSEWKRHEADARRKRVYRKLFFSPIVYREGEDDPDFAYIRNFRNRMRDDIEDHTPFRLEIFKNAAMLVMPERKQLYTLFPDSKAITDIVLHFSAYIRDQQEAFRPNALGEIKLTQTEFERTIETLKNEYGHGWGKAFREATVSHIAKELIATLKGWEMAEVEEDAGVYILKSGVARMSGYYPKDYLERRESDGQGE